MITKTDIGLAREFARRIVTDKIYQDNLLDRARCGDAPPQIETLLWHYAFGKPVDELNVTVSDDLSQVSLGDLKQRLNDLEELERQTQAVH